MDFTVEDDEDVDIARVENDDTLLEARPPPIRHGLVEVFADREQVHPAAFHGPNDLEVGTDGQYAGRLRIREGRTAYDVVVDMRFEDVG